MSDPVSPPAEPEIIPLTAESARVMREHLYDRFRYEFPIFEDNPDDFPRLAIYIYPDEESQAMIIEQHQTIHSVQTWQEWETFLTDVMEPKFDPRPYWYDM